MSTDLLIGHPFTVNVLVFMLHFSDVDWSVWLTLVGVPW